MEIVRTIVEIGILIVYAFILGAMVIANRQSQDFARLQRMPILWCVGTPMKNAGADLELTLQNLGHGPAFIRSAEVRGYLYVFQDSAKAVISERERMSIGSVSLTWANQEERPPQQRPFPIRVVYEDVFRHRYVLVWDSEEVQYHA